MAKRARGASGRPGQRRAVQRSAARPAPRPVEATPAGQTTAAELTDDAPESIGAETAARPSSGPRGRTRGASTSFEESAAQEYAYVASDVRRIAVVGGSLFAVLIGLWLVIEVFGIVKI